MPATLLATKLFTPPARKNLVPRPKLFERLDAGLQHSHHLILVSAPAGFGKTTLASKWVSSVRLPTTWLSLDRGDDDPGRFFAYFIAALQKVDEHVGREIESLLRSGQLPPLPVLAANLINDILAAGHPFILVLDDFHVIQDPSILDVLETLLANSPEQLHLVLITRQDPPLPLSRLRANNQMTEIRAEDLRFSEPEVGLFLNGIMGLALSEGDIAALEDRTEGWAAGLQLAAVAMHSRSDVSAFISHLTGSHRYFLSYLTEEVLSRQTEDIQNFLLQTSILDKLCADLCDAVTGRADSRALLDKCFHANLFLIPLDDQGRWYRYHHLFQDLLRNQQTRNPQQDILERHRRASRWYQRAGMISASMEHALIAADFPHAVQLLEDHAREMIMQGYMKTMEGWMAAIPAEWQSHNPRANLAFAWMHILRGSYASVMPYLQQAERAISRLAPDDRLGKPLRAESLALQANLLNVQGNPEQSLELATQALQWTGPGDFDVKGLAHATQGGAYHLMGDYAGSVEAYQLAIQDSRVSRNMLVEMVSVAGLMMVAIQHGRLHFAYEVGSQALERREREADMISPISGVVHASLGAVCYQWNRLQQASAYLSRGIQLGSLSGHSAGVVYAKVLLAHVFQAQGDAQAALKTVQEVAALLPLEIPAWLEPQLAAHLVRFYLRQGSPMAAESLLEELGMPLASVLVLPSPSHIPDPLTQRDELASIIALRLILHHLRQGRRQEQLQHAIHLAGCLVDKALPVRRIEIALQALILRAQLITIQGNPEAGLDDLLHAVELAEPEGYLRTFLDEDPAFTPLLELALRRPVRLTGRQVGFIQGLLASLAPPGLISRPTESHPRHRLPDLEDECIEPLTDREIDVLRLMAEGLRYQEIADRLVITLNTVRFYVKEIYSKLNVNNRTRALEAARRHDLL